MRTKVHRVALISLFGLAALTLVANQSSVRGADNKAPPPLPGGGSISFDPQNLPYAVAAGQALAGTIVVPVGTYTGNGGDWTLSAIQIEVRPVGGGAGGNTGPANNIKNPKWGGGNVLNPPTDINVSAPGGGAFPAGMYNVQASITFTKNGQPNQTTWTAVVVVEVK